MSMVSVDNNAYVLHMPSEVTASAENAVMDAYARSSPGSIRNLILNFSQVEYLNSAGASLLVKLYVQAKQRRQLLKAVGLSEHYQQVFVLIGLNRAMLVDLGGADTGAKAGKPRDAAHWAKPVSRLKVPGMPTQAINLNVEGRRVVGPIQGFGPMWQKTYRIRLGATATPLEVIKILKEDFPKFQPPENRFYPSEGGIKPGEVVLINGSTPVGLICTGVIVLYADDESFTFITPQGHPLSGWVTFTAYEDEGCTVAQVQGLIRSGDPLYELGFRVGGSKAQENIWKHVLAALAKQLGVEAQVDMEKTCIDSKLQWSAARNVWHNAQIRTMIYSVGARIRRVVGLVKR